MIDQLATQLNKNAITQNEEILHKFSVGEKKPDLVIFPERMNETTQILAIARKNRKKVLVLGNNSNRNFGSIEQKPDMVISTSRMNKILQHDVADLTVTVEAGVTLEQLQSQLKTHGQFLPLDLPLSKQRTLGGIVASNSFGPLHFRYGTCRDLILGMKIIRADGSVVKTGGKTVKNVAGYNLSRLFIGAMGTLAIISEMTFKLSPIQEKREYLIFAFDKLNQAADFVKEILNSQLVITSCEYFNQHYLSQATKNYSDEKKKHSVILNVSGNSAMVNDTVSKSRQIAQRYQTNEKQISADTEAIRTINQLDESENKHIFKENTVGAQISVGKGIIWELIDEIERYFQQQNSIPTIHSHAGNGIVNVYFGNEGTSIDSEQLKNQIQFVRQCAQRFLGEVVINHAPLEFRDHVTVWGISNRNMDFMKSIKQRFDPDRLFVSGRFVGGL